MPGREVEAAACKQRRQPRPVERHMLEGMKGLTLEKCNRELTPFLTDGEIRTMLVRRDLLLKLFASKVAEDGAASVFTDMPVSTPHVTIP